MAKSAEQSAKEATAVILIEKARVAKQINEEKLRNEQIKNAKLMGRLIEKSDVITLLKLIQKAYDAGEDLPINIMIDNIKTWGDE